MADAQPRPTYWDYVRVEELLSLQGGIGTGEHDLDNDEVRFIVIHQVDELWFKLVLRELQAARDLFDLRPVPETAVASGVAALRRVALIFQMAAEHFRLMETMRTQDYLRFRDKLSPASGFQSAQMREIEVLLGLDDEQRVPFGAEASYLEALRGPGGASSPALERVQRRQRDRPTLKEAVYRWLHRTPIDGSTPDDADDERIVGDFIEAFLASHGRASESLMQTPLELQALTEADRERLRKRYRDEQASARAFVHGEDIAEGAARSRMRRLRAAILFIDSNRQLPLLSWPGEVIDALIEAEQAMLIFRQRHARMVERVIGRRVGTGGSSGVDYLDRTALGYRVFGEIWQARTLLLQPELTPPVRNPGFYGLRLG